MDDLEFRKAMGRLRAVWSRGNAYFDRKQPWSAVKTDPDDAAVTLRTAINLIAVFARLSAPVMPFTADTVLDALGVPTGDRGWPTRFEPDALAPGHRFSTPPVLFRKLTEADLVAWRERFGDVPVTD
jgi:methionyl-tRNA synthetase